MAVVLIPCLVRLRAEFDLIAPARGRASDGWIGDTAHQAEVSDHNDDETGSVPIHDADTVHEVHAIDVDSNLCEPGLDMERVVQFLLARCRFGRERRLRYMIYNRRIWEASNGWRERPYTGASAHTEHAHFSASYASAAEADTHSWHLEDIPVALTQDDKDWIAEVVRAEVAKTGAIVAGTRVNVTPGGLSASLQPWGAVDGYGSKERHAISDQIKAVAADVKKLLPSGG